MSELDHGDFSVEDVVSTPPSAAALRHDIEEASESMRTGTPDQRIERAKLIGVHQFARLMGGQVLQRLLYFGVEEAAVLAERLEEINAEGNKLEIDMFAVAHRYDEDYVAAEEIDEKAELKRLGSLADAVAGIAAARMVALLSPDHPERAFVFKAATQRVEASLPQQPEDTATALQYVLREVEENVIWPAQG